MILERGDMFSVWGKTNFFMVTTNPIRRKDGAVVMGAGIAKQVKERYPQLPFDFGKKLDRFKNPPSCGIIGKYDGQNVGYFMVKNHWAEPANLSVIANSTALLVGAIDGIAECLISSPVPRIDLNFPGIGNGRLRREDVLPIISQLPDNVHVWEYE